MINFFDGDTEEEVVADDTEEDAPEEGAGDEEVA